jgi:hypothetical protein
MWTEKQPRLPKLRIAFSFGFRRGMIQIEVRPLVKPFQIAVGQSPRGILLPFIQKCIVE